MQRVFCLCTLLLLVCEISWSQEVRDTITRSVITASKVKSATRNIAPVTSVDSKAMLRMGAESVSELIKSFAGVSVRDYGGVGGLKSVSVRSLGAQHTAVNYDGIPVTNTQSGQVDISRFSLDNIEQVSMEIGQSDDIFQPAKSFTGAALLSIVSAKPQFDDDECFDMKAKMRYGSFKTYNPSLTLSAKLGKQWYISLSEDYLNSDGTYPFKLVNYDKVSTEYRYNSDVRSSRTELNFGGNIGKMGGELKTKLYYYDSERGLPGGVILYNPQGNERLWDRVGTAQVIYKTNFSNSLNINVQGSYTSSYNRYRLDSDRYSKGFQQNDYHQREGYISLSAKYQFNKLFSLALAHDESYATLWSDIPEHKDPRRWTTYTSVSSKFNSDRFSGTATLLFLSTREWVSVGDPAPDRQRLTPSLALSYKLMKEHELRVRASYRSGYRIPTFNDLYYLRTGDANLKPELAHQFNLGITYSGDIGGNASISVTADAFFNDVSDKIVAIPTLFIWRMHNMGRVHIAGLDLSATSDIYMGRGHKLLIIGSYTYQYAVDVSDPQGATYLNQIPYTPRHNGNISLSWINRWVNVTYNLTAVSQRWGYGENSDSNRMAPYLDNSISAHRSFKLNKVELLLRGELLNFTNNNYEIIKYYPMPGCSFRLSLEIKI